MLNPSVPPAEAPSEPRAIDWLDAEEVRRVSGALANRTVYTDESTDAGGSIAFVQTHISSVFLTPRFVFKFKRPVDVGFADFTTLERRRRDCLAEVELNRRLAPGVYLAVLPLCAADGGYRLGADAPPVDYCVVMTRLAAARMLDQRLRAGGIAPREVEQLARLLVAFHRDAAGGAAEANEAAVAAAGSVQGVRANWDENFRQCEPFVGTVLERDANSRIRAAVEDWLSREQELLQARLAGGYVRDGHGDLRCEHVYLGETIKVIDCVEFNERFRYGDVANDLAFLLMDLTALGHPAQARILLERYVALSGDADLPRLEPFYACYRAYVRCKVTAFKLHDRNLSGAQRAAVTERARHYFRLAATFAEAMAPPLLLLIGGLMGTGKSALAEALARHTGMATYNSDAVRKALAAGAPGDTARPWGEGIYTDDWSERTYTALLAHAEAELRAGRSVILDASFARRADRTRARALAERSGARWLLLECRLDEARTMERLRRRSARGDAISDGREALYAQQRAAFEPVLEVPPRCHRIVDTGPATDTLATALLPDLRLPPPPFGAAAFGTAAFGGPP